MIGRALDWDRALLYWINHHHNVVLDAIFRPVALVGEAGAIWVLAGLGMMVFGRGRARALGLILLATMMIADRVIEWPLRELVVRERPHQNSTDIRQIGIVWSTNSFPSAHATSVTTASKRSVWSRVTCWRRTMRAPVTFLTVVRTPSSS